MILYCVSSRICHNNGMSTANDHRQQGFTLPELLVTTAAMLVLLGVGLWLVRPVSYAITERDAERRMHIAAILQAVNKYRSQKNTLPPSITTDERVIGNQEDESNLCADIVPEYMKNLPVDPHSSSEDFGFGCNIEELPYSTGYTIKRSADGKVTIAAPAAEGVKRLTITR